MGQVSLDGEVLNTVDVLNQRLPMGWRVTGIGRVEGGMICAEVEGPGGTIEPCPCTNPFCVQKRVETYPVSLALKRATPGELVHAMMGRVLAETVPAGSA